MPRRWIPVLALVVAGCDGRLTRALDQKNEVISKEELHALRAELVSLRAAAADAQIKVGRFQHFSSTGRIWRFDTATGKVCLLLAPEADWKADKTACPTDGR